MLEIKHVSVGVAHHNGAYAYLIVESFLACFIVVVNCIITTSLHVPMILVRQMLSQVSVSLRGTCTI